MNFINLENKMCYSKYIAILIIIIIVKTII